MLYLQLFTGKSDSLPDIIIYKREFFKMISEDFVEEAIQRKDR